jgi:hypothetical protein
VAYTLRPLSLAELLDRTFFLYRRHFLLFVGIAAIPNLFGLAFGIARLLITPNLIGILVTLFGALASMFVILVTTALAQGATVIAVSQIQLDRPTNVVEAFNDIRGRLGELLLLMFNVGIRVVIGLICLIIPGIIMALMYSLAVPVAVLERTRISESLSRSADLTRGHRGRIFLIYLLLFVFTVIGGLLWQVPEVIVIRLVVGTYDPNQLPVWAQILSQAGNFATQSVFGPVATIALALVYYDERVRKEAFDLTHMMQQLEQAGASRMA